MNRPRYLRMLLTLVAIATLVAGCRSLWWSEQEPGPFTEAEPGPWKDVKISIPFEVGETAVKIRIMVENYPKKPDDYVRKFELFDSRGDSVGQRVFAYEDEPRETFILDPKTKQVTVFITSTGRGKWRSNPLPVPALKSGQ